jgi:hypothetical protein
MSLKSKHGKKKKKKKKISEKKKIKKKKKKKKKVGPKLCAVKERDRVEPARRRRRRRANAPECVAHAIAGVAPLSNADPLLACDDLVPQIGRPAIAKIPRKFPPIQRPAAEKKKGERKRQIVSNKRQTTHRQQQTLLSL